jgi:predicted nuclease of predicted toxin-antitoxin system
VRLFLDAYVSARRIAAALREVGHDVRSADEERALDGWEDERLLELATTEQRVMVTFNVKDFARLATEWAAAGTAHAGILLIVGIDHAEFGLTLRVIEAALVARPTQESWTGYAAWGTRSTGT